MTEHKRNKRTTLGSDTETSRKTCAPGSGPFETPGKDVDISDEKASFGVKCLIKGINKERFGL